MALFLNGQPVEIVKLERDQLGDELLSVKFGAMIQICYSYELRADRGVSEICDAIKATRDRQRMELEMRIAYLEEELKAEQARSIHWYNLYMQARREHEQDVMNMIKKISKGIEASE